MNSLHTDVRMFCSVSFICLLCYCVSMFSHFSFFVQLVLLVCKHFHRCTKQNAVFIHSDYFVTYFKTINSFGNFQLCLCFCFYILQSDAHSKLINFRICLNGAGKQNNTVCIKLVEDSHRTLGISNQKPSQRSV